MDKTTTISFSKGKKKRKHWVQKSVEERWQVDLFHF